MKIYNFFTMAMVALVMTNCSQNENLDEIIQEGITEFVVDVEGQSQSRSTMTDGGKFSWTTGDQISVWNGSSFVPFTCSNGNTFSGNATNPSKYAVYPAGSHAISGNNVTVNLPSTYGNNNIDYVQNTNAIMLASVQRGNNNLTFKHLGGLMRFNIKNVPSGTNKFVFTSTDKDITGDFSIEDDIILANNKNSNNQLTINFKSLTSTRDMTFYIPLPTGTYNGFKIELKGNSTNLSYESPATNTINRRTLLLMPTFVCENGMLNKQGSASVDFSNNNSTTTKITTESVEVKTATATGNSFAKLSYDPNSQPTLNLTDDNKKHLEGFELSWRFFKNATWAGEFNWFMFWNDPEAESRQLYEDMKAYGVQYLAEAWNLYFREEDPNFLVYPTFWYHSENDLPMTVKIQATLFPIINKALHVLFAIPRFFMDLF